MTFSTFLKQLEKARLLRYGRVLKILFCSVQSAPAHLLVKSKIQLNAERLHIRLESFKQIRKLVSGTEFQNSF